MLKLLCLMLPLAFAPGLASAATAPRWWLVAAFLPVLLWKIDVARVPHRGVLLGFLAFALASLGWAELRLDGYQEVWHLSLLVAVFAVGSTQARIDDVLATMALGVAITLPLVILQAGGYAGIAQVAPPSGLFINRNILGEAAAALLVAMVYQRRLWLAIALAVIVALTRERAAFVALGAAAVVFLWSRHRGLAVLLTTTGLAFLFWSLPAAQERFHIWQDTLQGMSFWGNGAGTFFALFPKVATHHNVLVARPEYAHNEILHYLFEFGIGALALFWLAAQSLRGRREFERLVFVAILAESCFAFPLHMPVTGFLAALLAGRLCRTEPDLGGAEHAG